MNTLNGATLWFTGLPSSGKSTIAREVFQRLLDRGLPVELLDGAEVRESLSRGLSFSKEDREEHIRRIGYVAKLLSRNGVIAICAAVSPYRATRDEVRRNTTHFVEIYVECPVAVAEARDRTSSRSTSSVPLRWPKRATATGGMPGRGAARSRISPG